MAYVRNLAGLRDFFAYAIVYAPDFPQEDFLESHEQMTLERLFEELSDGLVYAPGHDEETWLANSRRELDRAYRAYTSGDVLQGARILQQLQRRIFDR